ncbi:GBP1 protein, partial [Amia calva]|nr:GBP1 protein [Amia calva]
MSAPVCLIKNGEDGKLQVVPEALGILKLIEQPVVAVAVVGLYRTGKSYLMNRLAGKRQGFSLGSTIQSHTKGIWMWCVPHPTKPDLTLVLLDTEGLGDVEKGDECNDNWIFALAVLLSSTLVYNSMGTINNTALEQLHYVTELSNHIKVQSDSNEENQSSELAYYFPSFVWTVRDFSLELEIDDQPITADQYLENSLMLKEVVLQGISTNLQKYNLPRECIKEYFRIRKCFVFDRPAHPKKMKRMHELTDEDLDPCFVQSAKEFCNYIFEKAEIKTMKGGHTVTGRFLGSLAEMYMQAICSGNIPCLDNAVLALAQIENAAAQDRAQQHYREKISAVSLPTESLQELSDLNQRFLQEALEMFMKSSFRDEEQKYQIELGV